MKASLTIINHTITLRICPYLPHLPWLPALSLSSTPPGHPDDGKPSGTPATVAGGSAAWRWRSTSHGGNRGSNSAGGEKRVKHGGCFGGSSKMNKNDTSRASHWEKRGNFSNIKNHTRPTSGKTGAFSRFFCGDRHDALQGLTGCRLQMGMEFDVHCQDLPATKRACEGTNC